MRVEGLPDALRDQDLDRKVPTSSGPRPLVEVLHGLAAHDAYHAGQIQLLKRMANSRSTQRGE